MTLCHNCSDTRIEYTGNGTVVDYSFSFQYNTEQDVKVANWDPTLKVWSNVDSTLWSLNSTVITFTTAPADGQKFIIYRCTDLSPLPAQFNAGSSIKAQDLNDNFFVLQSAIEEARCSIERQREVSDERYLQELSDDTTPQLGGELDLNGYKLKGILKVDSSDQNNQGTIRLSCKQNDDHFVALKAPSHNDFTSSIKSIVFRLPADPGSSTKVLGQSSASDDGNGNYTVDLDWVTQASGGGGGGGITELKDDTSPQLGGPLDMNGEFISSGVLGVKNTGSRSQLQLFCESNNLHYVALQAPAHSDFSGNITFTLPATDGTANQVLKTDGNGNLGWVAQSSGGGGGLTRAQATAISLIFS